MNSLSRNQVVGSRDIVAELESRGVELIGGGAELKARCPFHEDSTPSFSVNVGKQTWNCFGGCGGGSIVDLIAKFDGKDPKAVFREIADEISEDPFPPAPPARAQAGVIKKIYSYRDGLGNELYQVCRLDPKLFRQRHRGPGGEWVWKMDGVTRVLYRLPEIQNASEIWIVEGEKDAETLVSLGFEATCNVGGAGKWLDSYTETLSEKNVVLCGDNDSAGRDHVKKVMESLAGKVASLRHVKVPGDFKDLTDYFDSFGSDGSDRARKQFQSLRDSAPMLKRGLDLPLKSIAELEAAYVEFIKETQQSRIDLSLWLPSFKACCRPLVPGDLVTVLAGTAVGKTAILQNIAHAMSAIPTVMYELELSGESMFERFVGHKGNMTGWDVEESYRKGVHLGQTGLEALFANLLVCTTPKLSVESVIEMSKKAELKLGRRPQLILLDYIQLVTGKGSNRYERFSDIAEDLRSAANMLRAAIVVTSQVKRGDGESPEVSISDGKESGSIENSSSLVLGAWREPSEEGGVADLMTIKVLKNTRGTAGREIKCKWSPTMRITEIRQSY